MVRSCHVSQGGEHMSILTSYKNIFMSVRNFYGQLGRGVGATNCTFSLRCVNLGFANRSGPSGERLFHQSALAHSVACGDQHTHMRLEPGELAAVACTQK